MILIVVLDLLDRILFCLWWLKSRGVEIYRLLLLLCGGGGGGGQSGGDCREADRDRALAT